MRRFTTYVITVFVAGSAALVAQKAQTPEDLDKAMKKLMPANAAMNKAIRWMFKPSLDGASHDCYGPTTGGLDVHYSSGIANLAFYLLKQKPAQPEAARRLALYALTLSDRQFPNGRLEDWTTLAIASALAGRERDARNAWFVTLSLAPTLDRQCRAAVAAYASHGERLRAPTEAML